MAIISVSNVSKVFNNDLILDHISFQINKNEKVALIGDNGTGKTTIFKLILKEINPTLMPKEDKVGKIDILKGLRIGYLSQDAIKDVNHSVEEELEEAFTYVKKMNDEFNEATKELSNNPNDTKLLEKYNYYLEKLEKYNAYNYKNEIETMISKFSFPLDILPKKIKEFSGGERMKIAFIKLLLFKYDVLLLDEPTNHLDISTIEWLENYLKSYEGTIVFISHDRYFLETLATKILELENQKVTTYNTNYDDYLKQKEINYNNLLKQQKKEEEEMVKLKKFIEFYMPKPRFVGRAKDRVHKLEKLEANHVVAPKKENHNIKINLSGGNLSSKCLMEIKDLSIGYDKELISKPINFSIYGKDKIAIIGDNGIGKTTLVKTLLKEIKPLKGEINYKRELKIGYIKQNDYKFNPSDDILTHLKRIYPAKSENELRVALGRFLFKKEEVYKSTSVLSNGEKMRVNLCALMLSSYDILVLDEPTNHLDMVTKECLIEGLKNYNGAILFISHDRYFINEVADYILYLSKENVIYFEGNYDEFKLENDSKLNLDQANLEQNKKEEPLVYDKIEKKEVLSKNKINEYKKRLSEIEEDIATLDSMLEEDFVDYKKIEELQDKKDELESEYLEILNKLS